LSILLKDELSLETFVLVLASPAILSSLSLVLRHLDELTNKIKINGLAQWQTKYENEKKSAKILI
jgi:hypothetical protein